MILKSDLKRIQAGYEPRGDSIFIWTIYTILGIFFLIKLRIMMIFK